MGATGALRQAALSRLDTRPLLADHHDGDHDRGDGVHLRQTVQRGARKLSADARGRFDPLAVYLWNDNRRVQHVHGRARYHSKGQTTSLHAYRSVYRNVLVLAHNFVIVPVVLIIFPHPVNWLRLFSLLPAFAFIVINGVTTSILLGMICARFRDVPPIVSSVVQVLFSSPRSFVHRARSARTAGGWCSTRYSRPSTWCVVRFSVSRPLLTHGRSWSPLPC